MLFTNKANRLLVLIGWMIAGFTGIKIANIFSTISLALTPQVPAHLIMKAYGAKRLYPNTILQLHKITHIKNNDMQVM